VSEGDLSELDAFAALLEARASKGPPPPPPSNESDDVGDLDDEEEEEEEEASEDSDDTRGGMMGALATHTLKGRSALLHLQTVSSDDSNVTQTAAQLVGAETPTGKSVREKSITRHGMWKRERGILDDDQELDDERPTTKKQTTQPLSRGDCATCLQENVLGWLAMEGGKGFELFVCCACHDANDADQAEAEALAQGIAA